MTKWFLFAFCLLVSFGVTARDADGKYAVSEISPFLKMNANAVIRLQEIRFEIKGLKETTETRHYVVTVLNEKGDQWAEFSEYYDNFRSIASVEGFLYDPFGKMIRKVKKKDMQDYKGDNGSFVDDSRFKVHNFYQRSYPYTIEYVSQIDSKSSLFFPAWNPRPGYGVAVEKSSMTVVCPASYEFRYISFLYNGGPDISAQKEKKITTWAAVNLPAITREPYAPLWQEMTTMVFLGPGDFQIGDYKGNMSTWESFGRFVQALKSGRDQLPDNIRREVHQIADGIAEPRQKIRALYEYMQRNTHYVGIQLGIGGWQPFDATYVANNRYGDCKALTNYMYSLLKEAGINSCYTLVRAGRNERDLVSSFPSQQFNHVILCVPLQQDTVWLECTSQTLPAGYLSDFTSGRFALLVDESGGKLVKTPEYGIKDNFQRRSIKAVLQKDGDLKVHVITDYRGLMQDNTHGLINNLSQDKVKEYLQGQLDFASYNVELFNYREDKNFPPSINEALDITAGHYATVTGKRLFIVPNVMTRWALKLSSDSVRRYAIQLGMAYVTEDSIEIDLPDGYKPESLPADVNLITPFGTYSSSTALKDGKIYYYRRLEHFGGKFPATDYAEVVRFYEGIYKADRARLVLVKN